MSVLRSYIESDAPKPVNFYGGSKLRGEQLLLDTSADFAVLRLPILYGQVERVEESAVLVLLNRITKRFVFNRFIPK